MVFGADINVLFAASLGASPALIGLLAALYGIIAAMVAVRVGRWIDRTNNFSTQALAISMATFLGPLSAGIAIDHLGYANAFFVTVAFGFTPMAVVWMGAALGVGPVYWAVAACMFGDAWANRGKLHAPKKL